MATKLRNLYLYLTIACFIGIIAIFIVDGYMGIYDTIYVTSALREQKIEPDFWLRGQPAWSTYFNAGEEVSFRYEVANHQFSQYSTHLEVSVCDYSGWRMQEKLLDVASQSMVVAAFDKGEIEWVVDTAEFRPDDIPQEQGYQLIVVIERGEIERKVILDVGAPFSQKPVAPRPVPAT